jgi:hypothetical protein
MGTWRSNRGTGHRQRLGMWGVAAVLAAGLALAACSSGSSSPTTTSTGAGGGGTTAATGASGGGSAASVNSIVSGITKTSNTTFSTTYTTSDSQTGQSQTVTFAQSPPKSAVITKSGSFYINGSTVTECNNASGTMTCTALPSSLKGSVSSLTNLFSPGVLTDTLKGIQAESVAHAAGVSITTSSGTYGGYPSTCLTAKVPTDPSAVTYCAAKSNGILTYSVANGNTVTLTAYTANPPASTFSPPAGATTQTLPAGA